MLKGLCFGVLVLCLAWESHGLRLAPRSGSTWPGRLALPAYRSLHLRRSRREAHPFQLRMQDDPDNVQDSVLRSVSSSRRLLLQSFVLGQVVAAPPSRAASASQEVGLPPPLPNGVVFEPGGAVLAAQRAAADEEARRPQSVSPVRALSPGDVPAMFELTMLQGWGNTKEDLQLLLNMKDSRACGVFSSSGQLVSMCAVTHLPPKSAWLSYVITRKDFRRRGLARATCTAALEWLDATHPGSWIGLYGEPTKAAPLYTALSFADVGKTRFWGGSYSANAVLAADSSSSPASNGKRQVNAKVRAITVGASTALTAGKGSVLLPSLLANDERLLGASRAQALRAWQKEAAFLSWVVPDIDRKKVHKIFLAFRDSESGRIKYEGLRDLNQKTVGILVEEAEFKSFCRRVGADPALGLGEDALFEIYAQPGNDVNSDYRILFASSEAGGQGPALQAQQAGAAPGCPRLPGGYAPWCACNDKTKIGALCWSSNEGDTPLRGYVMGRPTRSGFALGPLVAADAETATALLVAALRGAAVDHKLKDKKGDIEIELLEWQGPGSDPGIAEGVLESLGLKPGGQSRFMVRAPSGGNSMQALYPAGARGGLIAASSFEYA
jgi:RimJ/RimL family protein N-acetyltransferase